MTTLHAGLRAHPYPPSMGCTGGAVNTGSPPRSQDSRLLKTGEVRYKTGNLFSTLRPVGK
ncbi:hypothetical protein D187_000173 [Cystobacter fuscus DSM 2262]|uniref:Uncharacterized protein n=1 Tax=Cystobacter fuscus (strain ATCC 25194 / DSM 2262 / NBRC 100088 / M29) TaxID=1242864 RepID=S9PNZ8_CYSF2|nr:hypothetical protein D187_000173 [Cystobacter fuscus DSM 2262]